MLLQLALFCIRILYLSASARIWAHLFVDFHASLFHLLGSLTYFKLNFLLLLYKLLLSVKFTVVAIAHCFCMQLLDHFIQVVGLV